MSNIPLFDSLTHPTMDGTWIQGKNMESNHMPSLVNQMELANVKWAFAVGTGNIGKYSLEKYADYIRRYSDSVYPIAYFDEYSLQSNKQRDYLNKVKNLGYHGIKIHPRFSNLSLENNNLVEIIEVCNKLHLLVMLCTYFYDQQGTNDLYKLIRLLGKVKNCKVVLLHSGTVRLLEVVEIARLFPNVLLDLSFTICKYEHSSIDLDIKYVFAQFDQRVCVGSDSPEFDLATLRRRFDSFAKDVNVEKATRIGFENLMRYKTEW